MCIKKEKLKFVDISYCIAPGFSYSQYHGFYVFVLVLLQELFHCLRVVILPYSLAQLVIFGRDVFVLQCTENGFVRWQLADVQFVQGRHLLVREEPLLFCTSTLKNENISAEDYQLCPNVWTENDMKTMKEVLTWYNNKDVEPMLDLHSLAVFKHS
jgi:hypothetical protein